MATVPIPTRIDSVRFYRTGATVRRIAEVPTAASGSRLSFGQLPLCLDDATVRLEATGGVVLADAAVALDVAPRAASEGTDDERIERKLTTKMDGLDARIGSIATALEALAALEPRPRPPGPEGEPPRPIDLGARLALLDFKRRTSTRLAEERRTLEAELRALSEERKQIRERRSSSHEPPRSDELSKVVVATLRGSDVAAFTVTLEYFVPLARWAPCYVLRIDTAAQRVRLELRASAWQRTGEEYRNVAVSFSSARADQRSEWVDLQSLKIGRAQPPPARRMWRPVERDPAELFADYERAVGRPEPPKQPEPAMDPSALLGDALSARDEEEQAPYAGPAAFQAAAPVLAAGLMATRLASPQPVDRRARSAVRAHDAGPAEEGRAKKRAEPEPLPGDIAVDERMLAYGDLRMPPPEERVGKLRATTARDRWADEDRAPAPLVSARQGLLARAEAALEAPLSPLPARHVEPEPLEGFDSIYLGDSRIDLPTDDVPATVPIRAIEGPLSMLHVAVPRECSDVFRVLEMDNGLAGPLLRGPCDVYFDGQMLTTIDLGPVPPGGRLRAGLGVDPAVKCSRNTTYQESTSGLMGGSLSLTHAIRIDVVNHRTAPIDLEVRERIPFAPEREEDVKVDVVSVSPEWKPYRPLAADPPVRGGHAWRSAVGPSKRATFEAVYTIKLPSKLELAGGNRRD